MERKRANTRLDGPRRTPSKDVADRAQEAFEKWLRGEVDRFEATTTPQGERIVDTYNRAGGEERH